MKRNSAVHGAPATANGILRRGALVVTAVLILSACGDDGGQTLEESVPDDVAGDADDADDADDQRGEAAPQSITFLLPDRTVASSGFTALPATCDSQENHTAYYTHAVPEEWQATGSGSAGAAWLSGRLTLTFMTPDGQVELEMTHETRSPDESPESFDYEIETSDGEIEITFDTVATVMVGNQEVDLEVADQSQFPPSSFSRQTDHKARLDIVEFPNPVSGTQIASLVVTISHDADQFELADETVTTIIESFAVPECTHDLIVEERERILGVDLEVTSG